MYFEALFLSPQHSELLYLSAEELVLLSHIFNDPLYAY